MFVYDKSGKLRKRFDNEKAVREADVFTYEQVGQLVAELLDEDMPAEPDEATEDDSSFTDPVRRQAVALKCYRLAATQAGARLST